MNTVATEKPKRARAGKRAPLKADAPAPEPKPPAAPVRQYVDVDPWAVLLEQLMEVPEEEPAERKGGKRE